MNAEEQAILAGAQGKNYEDLSDEEKKVVDKLEVDAKAEFEREQVENDKKLEEDYKLAVEMDELMDKKESGKDVIGSCNAIDDSSTCVEYYGSFWNPELVELNCDESGQYLSKPCPSGMAGGCNLGEGGPLRYGYLVLFNRRR